MGLKREKKKIEFSVSSTDAKSGIIAVTPNIPEF